MNYMVINKFLNKGYLNFIKADVLNYRGQLSREGYDNQKTLRDELDPRHAETKYITDKNTLTACWNRFLWDSSIEEQMKRSGDGALNHALVTRHGKVLLSAYGNGDGYGEHIDTDLDCIVTCVLLLSLQETPKFTGGNLVVAGNEIPFEDNKLIIFPSCTPHSVTEVKLDSRHFEDKRFSLQYFISAVPFKTRFPDESSIK